MARPKSTEEMKKITFNAPAVLVRNLTADSDESLTDMLTRLMREENRKRIFREFIDLRGKIQFEQTWEEIKEARE